jgi:ribosomal-protein-alanine N-acetyltransferase
VTVTIRLLGAADAAALAALYQDNRAYLAPFEPVRPDRFYTAEGQAEQIDASSNRDNELRYLVEFDGRLAGRVNVTNIARGPFLSGNLGYWVAQDLTGRGIATRAVRLVLDLCFGEHGLHRVEAATLLDNLASQVVLRRNGFTEIGVAPRYLRIAGEWRDHLLLQRLAD